MSLNISLRFKPFSHLPGTFCLIPGTSLAVQVFPSCYSLYDCSDVPRLIETKPLEPFLEQFTLLQNLEQGKVEVSGFTKSGFQRHKIGPDVTFGPRERLFLGVDKSQDWQLVKRRMDMNEIMPYLYWLAQSVTVPKTSVTSELDLKQLFKAGFSDMLMPRLFDSDYHGFDKPVVSDTSQSPLVLLKTVFERIRSLFFQEHDDQMLILPDPSSHSGTMMDVKTARGHTITLEWTKHLIRRMVIKSACDDVIRLDFQNPIKSTRFQGERIQLPTQIAVTANQTYLFDNFQK
ncbi:MAG: hypothetical protein JSR37_02280 [Verrucomicrobia bacterium]|nr:hypothetical protein [Verrucomicrobiota bacterium]MBS0636418.1 hypothetical protein [Verrucomicrobiota bacterium]